jgi:hypothetical protein
MAFTRTNILALLMTKKSNPNIGVFLLGLQRHASMAGGPFFEMDQNDASAI